MGKKREKRGTLTGLLKEGLERPVGTYLGIKGLAGWILLGFGGFGFAQYVSDQPTTVIVSTSKSTPVLTRLSVLPCPNR